MTVNANTLYWLYSTIAQTLGAILGVGGMIVVFKLGTLRTARWSVIERLSEFCFHAMGDHAPPAEEILKECKELREKPVGDFVVKGKFVKIERHNIRVNVRPHHVNMDNPNIQLQLSKLNDIFQQENEIKPAFIRFFMANLFIIAISIVALIFCEDLSTPPWCVVAIISTVLGIGCSLYLMIQLCIEITMGK